MGALKPGLNFLPFLRYHVKFQPTELSVNFADQIGQYNSQLLLEHHLGPPYSSLIYVHAFISTTNQS